MENPVSFMADIVIVYIYVSPMNFDKGVPGSVDIHGWYMDVHSM